MVGFEAGDQLLAGEPGVGVFLQDLKETLEGDLFDTFGFGRGVGEDMIVETDGAAVLNDLEGRLIDGFGTEAVFDGREDAGFARTVETPDQVNIGDNVTGAADPVGVDRARIERVGIGKKAGRFGGRAFVEVVQNENAEAVICDLNFDHFLEEGQDGANDGDAGIGHFGQVTGENIEDDQVGYVVFVMLQKDPHPAKTAK